MRNRGSIVLIEKNKVVLIRRVREGITYYVFPGGGIEKDETLEAATKREAYEELGVIIDVKECIAEVNYNGTQYFFLGEITAGIIGKGSGEEYTDANRDRGTYQPMWVDIKQLSTLDVRPKEVAERVQSLLQK
ncbi:NUDIX domain-containing protein [Microbacteriaceae bacterium 4G12]